MRIKELKVPRFREKEFEELIRTLEDDKPRLPNPSDSFRVRIPILYVKTTGKGVRDTRFAGYEIATADFGLITRVFVDALIHKNDGTDELKRFRIRDQKILISTKL